MASFTVPTAPVLGQQVKKGNSRETAIGGAIIGGLAGLATGGVGSVLGAASGGSSLGGLLGTPDKAQKVQAPGTPAPIETGGSDAVSRRLGAVQNPNETLLQAQAEIKRLSPGLQAKLLPPIEQALGRLG